MSDQVLDAGPPDHVSVFRRFHEIFQLVQRVNFRIEKDSRTVWTPRPCENWEVSARLDVSVQLCPRCVLCAAPVTRSDHAEAKCAKIFCVQQKNISRIAYQLFYKFITFVKFIQRVDAISKLFGPRTGKKVSAFPSPSCLESSRAASV